MAIRKVVILLLSIVGLVIGAFVATRALGSNHTPEMELWPAFVMIFKEENYTFSPEQVWSSQTTELIYNRFDDWKVTLLDNAAQPDVKGMWSTYDGQVITHYDPRVGSSSKTDVSQDSGFHIPEQWLTPLYILSLQAKPDVIKALNVESGTEKLTVTEEIPCIADVPLTEAQKQAGLDECSDEKTIRVSTREITYTTEYLMPMQIVDKVDGFVVDIITVESLIFQ